MKLLIISFAVLVSALSPDRAALCQFAESIPYLATQGWKNCTEITDSMDIGTFGQSISVGTTTYAFSFNGFRMSGTLPDVFDKIPLLARLYLGSTLISGTLPRTIANSRLVELRLDNNVELTGALPALPQTLALLEINGTTLEGTIPSLSKLIGLTSLKIVRTEMTGVMPSLHNNMRLSMLIIEKVNVTGSLENIVFNTNLLLARVKETSISGTLRDFSLAPSLRSMEITNNRVSGTLPAGFSLDAYRVDFSFNRFSGTVPAFYFNRTKVRWLYLQGNDLSGTIPSDMAAIQYLDLSKNRLSGVLPRTPFIGNMTSFELANNEFSGMIPSTFFQSSVNLIRTINLSNNHLEGTLPDDFSSLTGVVSVDLSNNSLRGQIPVKLFSSLGFLRKIYLQNNKFNGTLAGSFQQRPYSMVSFANNSLSGTIPRSFFSGATFSALDISGNSFTGCGPLEPVITFDCNFGGAYYSGCTPSYAKCAVTFGDNCVKGSDYFGASCSPCNCSSGLVCSDGVSGDGTCDGFNPCRGNNCEGICNINGVGFVCSCPFPGIINKIDQKSCDCPLGFTKGVEAGTCIACPTIDNCLQIESCGVCSLCRTGYQITPDGQCLLNKNCLFSEWAAWSKCDECLGGVTLRYRELSEKNTALAFYCQEFLYNRTICGFPCVETKITSKDAILDYLYRSYTQWNWLVNELNLTKVNITKTEDSIEINPLTNLTWLKQSVHEILPLVNDTRYRFSLQGESSSIEVLEEEKPNFIGMAIGISAGLLAILSCIIFFLLRRRQKRWLFDLPDELHHYFKPKGSGWVNEGNCKMREIPANDMAFQAIWSKLSTKSISINKVHILSNSILAASFSNYRSILRQRMIENPILFCKKDWILRGDRCELRTYVHERYLELVEYFSWNDPEETVPIVACLHATDFMTAKSIASKGFCALATLDEGFYGKGIYFSTYGSYVAPYFLGKQRPAVLVNLVICGNPFPIVEAATDKGGFLGKPTASGYQSHFVLTKSDGMPVTAMHTDDESNEIVISQEAQVVPIYIVSVGDGHRLEQFTRSSSSYVPLLVDESEMP